MRIRPLDTRKDLLTAADLIETCFGQYLDPDGELYLSQIRKAANNQRLVRWTYAAGETVSYPLNGYVCEVDGKVVGNLSLIPIYWKRKWRYLIANVAVAPDYRRQGVASALTRKALEHVRKLPIDSVWLHVREDNDAAINLYERYHFQTRCIRDNWVSQEPYDTQSVRLESLVLADRCKEDWNVEKEWLSAIYPPEVAWHQAFDLSNYSPGILNKFRLFLEGKNNQQWFVRMNDQLVGVAALEKGYSYADQVFLAVRPGMEETVLPFLLPHIKIHHAVGGRLAVNYPAHQGREAFLKSGFELLNTLIWMEIRIN